MAEVTPNSVHDAGVAQVGECPRGIACNYAHNVFEFWCHPLRSVFHFNHTLTAWSIELSPPDQVLQTYATTTACKQRYLSQRQRQGSRRSSRTSGGDLRRQKCTDHRDGDLGFMPVHSTPRLLGIWAPCISCPDRCACPRPCLHVTCIAPTLPPAHHAFKAKVV